MSKRVRRGFSGWKIHIIIEGDGSSVSFVPLRGRSTPDLSLGPVLHFRKRTDFDRAMRLHDRMEGEGRKNGPTEADEDRWYACMEEIEKYLPEHWTYEFLFRKAVINGKASGEEVPC